MLFARAQALIDSSRRAVDYTYSEMLRFFVVVYGVGAACESILVPLIFCFRVGCENFVSCELFANEFESAVAYDKIIWDSTGVLWKTDRTLIENKLLLHDACENREIYKYTCFGDSLSRIIQFKMVLNSL